MKHIYLLILFLSLKIVVHAQAGSLDLSFGNGGKVFTDFGTHDWAKVVLIQPDGKIVVAGTSGSGVSDDFALARYDKDGSLDSTFGLGGKVVTDFNNNSWEQAWAAAIQNDGKIIVAGGMVQTKWDFALARYNTNGSLDTTFGTGGMVTTNFGNSHDQAVSIVIQVDGKIIAAGTSDVGTDNDFALTRYNSDGSVDTTYGTNGKVLTDLGGGNDAARSVAIQNDGKVVAAGNSDAGTPNQNDAALARYNTDGSLDHTFGSGGKVFYPFGNFNHVCYSVIVQHDNKILSGGVSSTATSGANFSLIRYNANGILDSSFGLSGKVSTDLGSVFDWGFNLAAQNDGKIVMAGSSGNGPGYECTLIRYNTDGSLDNAFGSGGKVFTNFGNNLYYTGYSVAIQADGKIVAAGHGNNDFAVARYIGCSDVNFKGINNPCDSYLADITEHREIEGVIIHPNPSSGIFTIELQNTTIKTKLCIYDILGNCLLKKECLDDEQHIIDLSGEPKGIYCVEIIADQERVVKKIIIH